MQWKGLALCLGAIGTSGREALEVELNVRPLEERRTELSLRETARILSSEQRCGCAHQKFLGELA